MTAPRVPALKEWAVVVDAFLEGEQILDLRKGGLREDGRHFGVKASRLWLYPTYLHQDEALLKPAYRGGPARTAAAAPPDDVVRIPGWADVVGVATVDDPSQLEAIDGRFVWTLDYATTRLKWKRRDPLWVLALRVHVLEEPIEVPLLDEYGGCTSWVDVQGLPGDTTEVASSPALSDEAFEARLKGAADALPGSFEKPRPA